MQFAKFFISFLLAGFASSQAVAAYTVQDVGIIGLMSHDVFSWDHKLEKNVENGRLDLSTIFDFDGGRRWYLGGNTKNSENAAVYSVAMRLVNQYTEFMKQGYSPLEARKATVLVFHGMIREFYERALDEKFPATALKAMPTNREQAAIRGFHDLLPGRINLYDRALRHELKLTNIILAKTFLNDRELAQELKPFDGDYDEEYKALKIPFTKVVLNLKEIDRKFIERFSDFKQADMLAQLKKVGAGEMSIHDISFAPPVKDLFRKAMCGEGNRYMPQHIVCE
ncbi:hypothetical protein B9G69_012085 [Bdellovibrio sp. SKB1291214]|uniref:hypothetical protein n=1 Tax=Bdellovibrio sp. SKB1291214 TaxID=1732569 RepID=UPI000B51B24D|nr:hypothetical protein [Bdellovibrio sp. SKB1291214]UYL07786.1 hypothetical protein B9G69_012085 [Bdellovibrio sp. SKB1291214]